MQRLTRTPIRFGIRFGIPQPIRFGIPNGESDRSRQMGSPQKQLQKQNYPIGPAATTYRLSVVDGFGEEIIIGSVSNARDRQR